MQPHPPDIAAEIARWEVILKAEGMPAELRPQSPALTGGRRQTRRALIAMEEATEPVRHLPIDQDAQEAAREALEPLVRLLSAHDQRIWRLRHRDGLRQREIAEIVGIAQATVSFRLRSSKRKLRYIAKYPPLHQLSPDEAARHIYQLIDEHPTLMAPPRRWKPHLYSSVVRVYWQSWDTQATGRILYTPQGTVYSRLEALTQHLDDDDSVIQGLQAIRRWKSWTTRHGVLPPDPHIIRPRAARKLTPALVRQLRQDYKDGMSFREIREKYGIADTTARRVVARMSWRWVV